MENPMNTWITRGTPMSSGNFPSVHLIFILGNVPGLVICYIANWKDPPFFMGKSIISMAIFNSFLYVHQRVIYFCSFFKGPQICIFFFQRSPTSPTSHCFWARSCCQRSFGNWSMLETKACHLVRSYGRGYRMVWTDRVNQRVAVLGFL